MLIMQPKCRRGTEVSETFTGHNVVPRRRRHKYAAGLKVKKDRMYRWSTICALVFLLAVLCTYAQGPVTFDDSRAKEMQTVWIKQASVTRFAAYMQNVADIPGNNIVAVFVNGEYRTWPTTPKLDTTVNAVQWINARPYRFTAPFDYDGQPPMEYFNSNGVFRPSLDGRVMSGIDTVDCLIREGAGSNFKPRFSADIDGDGRMDIVTMDNSIGDNANSVWFRVLLAGPEHGRGCSRVVTFPNGFMNALAGSSSRQPMRMMRCADGKLRVVWMGTFGNGGNSFRSGIYLLDVNLLSTDTGYTVSYTIADSITQRFLVFQDEESPWVIRPVICVDDAKNGHQFALVNWQDGYHINHNTTVMYEVSNGKLIERLSTKGHLLNENVKNFDNSFDDGEAVILYGRNVARIGEFHRPFAKIPPNVFGGDMAFIDDQFQDGSRDLLLGTENSLTLVNFDLRPTSVAGSDHTQPTWVDFIDGRLHLALDHTSLVSVEVVNSLGQKRLIVAGYHAPAGPSLLDVSQHLAALPKGAWFIRVSDVVRIVSLSYLR